MLNIRDEWVLVRVTLHCHSGFRFLEPLTRAEVGKANARFAGLSINGVFQTAIGRALTQMYMDMLAFHMKHYEWDNEAAVEHTVSDYLRLHPIRSFVMMGWRIATSLTIKSCGGKPPHCVEVYKGERLLSRSVLCECGKIEQNYFEKESDDIFEQEREAKEKGKI